MGFCDDSGRVFDAQRNLVGSVERFGRVLDENTTVMGWVEANPSIRKDRKVMAACALLLLL